MKKVNKVIGSDIEEANPYNNINKLDNGYKSAYLNNSKGNEDKFSFANIDINELKSILYQNVIILIVRVGDHTVLVMFITIIHRKGENRKP